MNYLKISIGIFLALAASRFIPHPPNFTSLIALSFYVPVFLGPNYILALILSFFLTDLIIGFHALTLFTWGSILIIGILSKHFVKNIYFRALGVLSGVFIFFLVTNFGVWVLSDMYEKSFSGLVYCYYLAIPFFKNTLISTIAFSYIAFFANSVFEKSFKSS